MSEADRNARIARGEVCKLTRTWLSVRLAWAARYCGREERVENRRIDVRRDGRRRVKRVVARNFVNRSRLIALQIIEDAERHRIGLESLNVRNAHAEVDIAEVVAF